MQTISDLIVKFRWLILFAIFIITVFFSYQFKFLEVDSNIIDALPQDDPVVRLFKDVGKKYGGTEIGMVVLESDNVFRSEVLKRIEMITDSLMGIDGLLSVNSITTIMSFNVEGDNFEVDNLISEWPDNDKEAELLRDRITKDKMVTGNLVSEDGNATAIIFTFLDDVDVHEVSNEVIKKVEALKIPDRVFYAGATFMTKYVADVISEDMLRLIPISFLLIAIILYMSFHSLRGIILPLLTAGLAIVWAVGTFILLGMKLSMVSNNVPIIILAVGSAYAIHVLNRMNQFDGLDPKEVVSKALPLIIVPVVLTALTTMIGFLSFIFGAYLTMIRDFGVLAAFGTFYSGILAVVLVPALTAISKKVKTKEKEGILSVKGDSILNRFILVPLNKIVLSNPKKVIWVWVILLAVGVLGIFKLERSVSVSDYFKRSHPVSTANDIMDKKFGGSKPVFVIFTGDMLSPEVLEAMQNVQNYMKASPYISNAQSISDVVLKLNTALSGEEKIPDEKEKIEQLWFLIGQNENINQLVTEDLDQGIILAKFNSKGQSEVELFDRYMQDYLTQNASDNYTVEITGMPYVNVQMDKSLVSSQIGSVLIAVVLVISIISIMFKSLKEGLFAGLPIIATIVILYGFMGITGIPLNIATVLVASVAMGIGIDYSIHFITHFNHALKKSRDVEKAISETMLVSGKAIFINFISVSAGFSVLVFSELLPMVYFGILIALSMLGSSMGALTLLPATLLFRPKNGSK